MDAKSCIMCGMDCQLEEAESSMMEIGTDKYAELLTQYDADWHDVYVPPLGRKFNVIALHLECVEIAMPYDALLLTPNWDALCEAISDALILAPDSAQMRVKAELDEASQYFDVLDEQDPSLKAMLYSMLNKLGYARIPFDAVLPHENAWNKLQ